MIGNVGNGKSATINKLNHWLTIGDPKVKMTKVVVSKKSAESVTIGASEVFLTSIHTGHQYRLIDT